MTLYVVDSNFFIQAHRATYPLDVATGFWSKIKLLAAQGTIVSIDKVRKELYNKNDDLENWCKANLPEGFFRETTSVIEEYRAVSEWAITMSNHYLPSAINEFLNADEADAFLIAFSMADPENRVVVTQEVSAPQKINKIKIPDCCNALGVNFKTTIEMYRELGETF